MTAIVFASLGITVEHYLTSTQTSIEKDLLVIHGAKPVDATELRAVILRNGLTVYWVGAEAGYKYLLNAAVPSSISVRYIPAGTSGKDATATYREVGTFVSVGAFSITQEAAKLENGVGFINVDGNAVYYDSRDPTNVYMGIKGKDIQIEIFDPRPDQSLAKVMSSRVVQLIK